GEYIKVIKYLVSESGYPGQSPGRGYQAIFFLPELCGACCRFGDLSRCRTDG
ncbi:unnamed protein product, partial [Mycena citricolor]